MGKGLPQELQIYYAHVRHNSLRHKRMSSNVLNERFHKNKLKIQRFSSHPVQAAILRQDWNEAYNIWYYRK